MQRFFPFLFVMSLGLGSLLAQGFDPKQIEEVPTYAKVGYLDHVEVKMAYASSDIRNPEAKDRWQERTISRIDLVFTRYPQEIDAWLTPYQQLFDARLAALRSLDSSLFTRSDIEWHYIQQTDCPTEAQAKQRFHGFVVYMEALGKKMEEVAALTYQQEVLKDSTAFQILERHPEWQNMLVVMDWTGSMYKYGASVLLWHRLNLERSAVSHFIFFNDGNHTTNSKKQAGRTGGVYRSETSDIDTVLRKMNEVMNQGNGGDDEENDVEALYKGMKFLEDYDQVILIADNHSKMRDLHLASHLEKPVRVILCGVDERHPVHPDYLTLARITGGSVHTIEADIEGLKLINEGLKITIDGRHYLLEEGRFRLLPVTDRM
jgi:hypothetical protein